MTAGKKAGAGGSALAMPGKKKAGAKALTSIPSASFWSSPEEYERWVRYNGLRNLARQVFLDRNAQGFQLRGNGGLSHDKTSRRIKHDTRPLLREAIKRARQARDSLLVSDLPKFEHMRDVARMNMAQAGASRKQPFMEARGRANKQNKVNASMPRPDAHKIDHDGLISDFLRLLREGHSSREARGILVQQGGASQSTVYRITKPHERKV